MDQVPRVHFTSLYAGLFSWLYSTAETGSPPSTLLHNLSQNLSKKTTLSNPELTSTDAISADSIANSHTPISDVLSTTRGKSTAYEDEPTLQAICNHGSNKASLPALTAPPTSPDSEKPAISEAPNQNSCKVSNDANSATSSLVGGSNNATTSTHPTLSLQYMNSFALIYQERDLANIKLPARPSSAPSPSLSTSINEVNHVLQEDWQCQECGRALAECDEREKSKLMYLCNPSVFSFGGAVIKTHEKEKKRAFRDMAKAIGRKCKKVVGKGK